MEKRLCADAAGYVAFIVELLAETLGAESLESLLGIEFGTPYGENIFWPSEFGELEVLDEELFAQVDGAPVEYTQFRLKNHPDLQPNWPQEFPCVAVVSLIDEMDRMGVFQVFDIDFVYPSDFSG